MELPAASNAFQIKPDLENILHEGTVKQLIQKVLTETLLNKSYSTDDAKKWTKTIADDINRGLKHSSRYKYVVQAVISQKLGQGYKFAAVCRWDSECDRQITDSFINDSMICVVAVFGVYLY